MVVQWLALLPHSKKVLSSNWGLGNFWLGQDLSVWSLHVLMSVWLLSGYSGFFPQSKDMQPNIN